MNGQAIDKRVVNNELMDEWLVDELIGEWIDKNMG